MTDDDIRELASMLSDLAALVSEHCAPKAGETDHWWGYKADDIHERALALAVKGLGIDDD